MKIAKNNGYLMDKILSKAMKLSNSFRLVSTDLQGSLVPKARLQT